MRRTRPTLTQGPDSWDDQWVMFCGHNGCFKAKVVITPIAIAVISKKPVSPDILNRKDPDKMAQWYITDAHGGYWNPRSGVFVLPRDAITRLQ